ncbi:MAG TPA: MauE/DoxX family redox-associated membrane protein [Gaiellaceae bacterium]|nr:MauE/DoxX family redox-associated membrane protein [Gaiellaceae bacterium]
MLEGIARIVVAVVLLWAALAKLRRSDEFPDWLRAYGVPGSVATPLSWGVIAAEATVGALLLAGVPGAPYAALGLGALFVIALAYARARGVERLRCGCFGAGEGRTTLLLLRALAFSGLAALAAWGGEVGLPGRDAVVLAALGVLAAAVAVLALLVLALYRQVGVLTLRLGPRVALELAEEGPAVGVEAPLLDRLERRGSELVVFASANCRLCRQLAPGISALAREGLAVRLVEEEPEPDAFERWNVPGTPFVVHVVDGLVAAKGTVNTLEEIDGLLAVGAGRVHAAA